MIHARCSIKKYVFIKQKWLNKKALHSDVCHEQMYDFSILKGEFFFLQLYGLKCDWKKQNIWEVSREVTNLKINTIKTHIAESTQNISY